MATLLYILKLLFDNLFFQNIYLNIQNYNLYLNYFSDKTDYNKICGGVIAFSLLNNNPVNRETARRGKKTSGT
jgi:hypothetical protein